MPGAGLGVAGAALGTAFSQVVVAILMMEFLCFLGQRVHMFVAEPAHVLELTIVVHSPRISQRHLVDLCCKLSFFFLRLDEPGIS